MGTFSPPLYLDSREASPYALGGSAPLTIAFVSPSYPLGTCAVSAYAYYLATHLQPVAQMHMIGNAGSSKFNFLISRVMELAGTADIVHIQHSFDLYGYMGY